MIKHKSIFIYLVLFLLIGIASMYILQQTKQTKQQATAHTVIESFAKEATFIEYNQHGMIKTTVHASTVMHYEPSGITKFENPIIETYTAARRKWHIRAREGVSNKTVTIITLKKNVIIHELPTKTQGSTVIKTNELTLYPKENRIETQQIIHLIKPGIRITGKGFSANLKTGKYELKSTTHAIYQPGKKNKME